MTEIERLKSNLDILHKAYRLSGMSGKIYLLIDRERDILRQRIADLEAQQATEDKWKQARAVLFVWEIKNKVLNYEEKQLVLAYVRELQHQVAELDDELRCERIDGGKVRDDLKAIDAEKNRQKLAELTTIANAIPPACGLARELVERRIEGVKREMQAI